MWGCCLGGDEDSKGWRSGFVGVLVLYKLSKSGSISWLMVVGLVTLGG